MSSLQFIPTHRHQSSSTWRWQGTNVQHVTSFRKGNHLECSWPWDSAQRQKLFQLLKATVYTQHLNLPKRVLWHWGQLALHPQAEPLDHGSSSPGAEVVGKGWLAWAKSLAKDHLDHLPVRIIMFKYLGINIPWQCLVPYYRKTLYVFFSVRRSKPGKKKYFRDTRAEDKSGPQLFAMYYAHTNNVVNFLRPFTPISLPDY